MSFLNIIERGELKYCGQILITGSSLEKVIARKKMEKGREKKKEMAR